MIRFAMMLGPLRYFCDTARKVTIQEPGEFGGVDVCPSNSQVSDSQSRSQTASPHYILPATKRQPTTMLIVTALILWSAASVASAMPVHVIRSAHESTTWNVTNTPLSGSSVSMNSNYYTYSSEERGGSPADIVTILKNFHASILPSAMSEIPQFEAMSEEFTRLTQSGETTSFVPDWEKFVKSQYPSHPQIAEKVIFLTLAHYFKDDVLRHFLVAGTKADTTRYIALKLLNLEINKWKNDGQSEAEVFKLLELQQPNGNLFEGPIFGKWIEFVQAKYEGQHERYKKMYEVLATHFEVDDLARILVKGAESDVGEEMNGRARSLLDFQVFMWNTLGRDEANVFKLLQLDTTKKPLESPVFSKWAKFVWLRYPKENPDKMILDKLSSIYKSKNALLGGLDTLDRAKASSQDKAAEKILEYQYKQWSNKDAKEVFDILELHRSDSNLLKRRPFPRGSASSRQYRRMV